MLTYALVCIQLDVASRGFSFRRNGPLDMRMNTNSDVSAVDIVNSLSESELRTLILKVCNYLKARTLLLLVLYLRSIFFRLFEYFVCVCLLAW